MLSDWYKALFQTRLASAKQSLDDCRTTLRGRRLATSVGGVLTGRGADFIIIDDPLKADEAMSEARRFGVNDWSDRALVTRLTYPKAGCIILIMQRLHEDDLTAHLLKQQGWKVLLLPAIAEQDEVHTFPTPYGIKSIGRRAGEALHPAHQPLDVLLEIQRTIGEYNFLSQYQQAPPPAAGGRIRAEWFKHYTADERPPTFDVILDSWDPANETSDSAAYSVCTTWGIKGQRIYLIDVFRKKLDYPSLKRAIRTQAELHHTRVVLIENRASGIQLIQELRSEGLRKVQSCEPVGDKRLRMHAVVATIENGFVFLPHQAPWLSDYIEELTKFPSSKYDDQVDSTSQALEWINQMPPKRPIIEYYRDLAKGLRPGDTPDATVQPVGVSIHEKERRALNDLCVECGESLGTRTIREGQWSYHPGCHAPL